MLVLYFSHMQEIVTSLKVKFNIEITVIIGLHLTMVVHHMIQMNMHLQPI